MLLVFLFAVQYSALGVYSRNAQRCDTDACFSEADYIKCTKVVGRPPKCDCGEQSKCYIRLDITRRPHFELGEQVIYEYLVNNEVNQGPTIIAKFNTIVVVDVYNYMNEDTSIHWHGVHQNSFPWFDGVGALTQYPIHPFGRFRYIFRAFPEGTHWYHSHTRFQRDIGLLGALIIRDEECRRPKGKIVDTPETHTMLLQERKEIDRLRRGENRTEMCLPDGSKVPSQFDEISILVNGRRMAARPSQRRRDSKLVFYVEPGKNHRFRIVTATSTDMYAISIQNHKMHVIATDGFLVRRFATDYLILHVSERYDFIVKGRHDVQPWQSFAIRVQTLAEPCDSPGSFAGVGYAHLVYLPSTAPAKLKAQIGREYYVRQDRKKVFTVLNCPMKNLPDAYFGRGTTTNCHDVTSLRLLYPTEVEHVPSNNPKREAFFDFLTIVGVGALVNGIAFINPSTPLVTNTKEQTKDCQYGLQCETPGKTRCTHGIDLGNDQSSVRFVFSAQGGESHSAYLTHPIHMHGHSFFVAKVGYPEYNEQGHIVKINNDLEVPVCGAGNWTNNTAPSDISVNRWTVRKDAITVPAGGYVVVDFITDNPGHWFLHCHIDLHLNFGMAIAVSANIDCATKAPDRLLDPDAIDFCMTLDEFKKLEASPECPALKKKKSKHGKTAVKKITARQVNPDQDLFFKFERKFQDERKFAGREEKQESEKYNTA